MVMDFPANGTQPHRQLLMTLPQRLAGSATTRRMLPEQDNATWGLDGKCWYGTASVLMASTHCHTSSQKPHVPPAAAAAVAK